MWLRHGRFHRDGDEPAIVWPDESKWWYRDGNRYYPDLEKSTPKASPTCKHDFIDVGFTSGKRVCKHCDEEEA